MAKRKKQIPSRPILKALKGKIREEGSSYRKLCCKIGISTSTLSLALNGYGAFDADVIEAMVNELNIDTADVPKYFFPRLLRNAT